MPPKRAYAPKDDFVVSDHELEGDGGARKKVKKMGNGSGVKGKGKGKEKGGKSGTMGEGKGVGALVGGGGIRDGKGEAFWEVCFFFFSVFVGAQRRWGVFSLVFV